MPASRLPPHHNLFIATPDSIQLHSQDSKKVLFECETPGGITNARAAKDNSCVLAVADSHVVILFDAEKGNEKKYRLKSGDGEPRLLLFSPSSQMLYFTTTLSHSIQAYSIASAQLLPPLPAHSSPPNVMVLSRKGDILLSASPTPPTVVLHDVGTTNSDPVHFFPKQSRSIVQCAGFLDDIEASQRQYRLFVLGFQDGTLTLYRLAIPAVPSNVWVTDDIHERLATSLRQPVKLGSIRRLHKAAMGGVCAAEFIPGFKARVVSIGHDGKCRIVDFEHGGEVLRTWRVVGLPTGLSVMSTAPFHTTGRRQNDVILNHDGTNEEKQPVWEGREILIAIGMEPPKVMVFNILGLLVEEVAAEGSIVSLEWVGDMNSPSALPIRLSSSPISLLDSTPASQPILHELLNEYEAARRPDGEEQGTVQRTKSPLGQSLPNGPIPFQPGNNLFSPPRNPSPKLATRVSHKPTDTPLSSPKRNGKGKRSKKYPRPRIVTETFTIPTSPPSSSFPGSPIITPIPPPPDVPAKSPARQWSQPAHTPERVFPLMSGALPVEDNHSISISMYSADDEEEESRDIGSPSSGLFFTPPTRSPNIGNFMEPQRSVRFEVWSPLDDIDSPAPGVSDARMLPNTHIPPRRSLRRRRGSRSLAADQRFRDMRGLLHQGDSTDEGDLEGGYGLLGDDEVESEDSDLMEFGGQARSGKVSDAEENVLLDDVARSQEGLIEYMEGGNEEMSDGEWLRAEMRALRREFIVLREAVLERRC